MKNNLQLKKLKEEFLKDRNNFLKEQIAEYTELLKYADSIGYPARGLRKQIKENKKALKLRPKPTQAWIDGKLRGEPF